jgi:hypothetical protein
VCARRVLKTFYTINSVCPIFAAVEDLDAAVYESLELGQVIDEDVDGPTVHRRKEETRPRAVSSSLRSMVRLLYTTRRWFPVFRGYFFLVLWNMPKAAALAAAIHLPSIPGLLVQTVVPVVFLQLHVLWLHTVITPASSKPFWRRIAPAGRAFKAAAFPMLLLSLSEAATQHILWYTYRQTGMVWEDFFPLGKMSKSLLIWALLLVLVTFLVLPAHLLLVRVEASLLPADEATLVPLDPSITSAQRERGYMTVMEFPRSLTRTCIINLVFLYFRIFLITAALVAFVGLIDFSWYIWIALMNWQF